MTNATLAFFALVGSLLAFTDLPEKMKSVFDESVLAAQQIATAGDLRSMSIMLDVYYFKRGRYPRAVKFDRWLEATFKESHLKALNEDHWGNKYIYVADSSRKAYVLLSTGPDGIAETSDDMTVSGP